MRRTTSGPEACPNCWLKQNPLLCLWSSALNRLAGSIRSATMKKPPQPDLSRQARLAGTRDQA